MAFPGQDDRVLSLRRLDEDDWQLWRRVRLDALREAPAAFGSTLAVWAGAGDLEERWRARLRDVAYNVVAEQDGRPVGQVSGTAPDASMTVELISLWVAPEVRGAGVGDLLVGDVVRWAQEQGSRAVTLSVKTANRVAIGLYERAGFRFVDLPSDPDEQVMLRTLG